MRRHAFCKAAMNPQGHAVVGTSQPRSIERLEDHSPREHVVAPFTIELSTHLGRGILLLPSMASGS